MEEKVFKDRKEDLKMKIENIKPEGYVMKGVYTPAKK